MTTTQNTNTTVHYDPSAYFEDTLCGLEVADAIDVSESIKDVTCVHCIAEAEANDF